MIAQEVELQAKYDQLKKAEEELRRQAAQIDYVLEEPGEDNPTVEIASVGKLLSDHPDLRPVVIDGLLRKGETLNIVAASKAGKSFLAGGLAWSIAAGVPWLGRTVSEGRVLIIDNELHPETLANRMGRIASAMMIDEAIYQDRIDIASVRGKSVDIRELGASLGRIPAGKYQLIVLDALYRTLPEGISENDNAEMMAVYNRLDEYASQWETAVAVVHHASKGDQSTKSVTDIGSGAGAISRAADTHLTIRPHEDDDLAVLEARCRSFKSPEPVSLSFNWPLWHRCDAQPIVRQPRTRVDAKQEAADIEADAAVLKVLEQATDWLAASSIRRKVGFGQTRVDRALVRLAERIDSKAIQNPRNKNEEIDVYRIKL